MRKFDIISIGISGPTCVFRGGISDSKKRPQFLENLPPRIVYACVVGVIFTTSFDLRNLSCAMCRPCVSERAFDVFLHRI